MQTTCFRCHEVAYFSSDEEATSKFWRKESEGWKCPRCVHLEDYENKNEEDKEFEAADHHHDDGDSYFNKETGGGGAECGG